MFELIRVFNQVVESGSFSQAANALSMAPSSVARNIDNLEAKLQTTLFKRSTRQLVLTDEGRYFHHQALSLVEEADALVNQMKQSPSQPQGLLRISAFESFGNVFLAPLIPMFLAQYPKVQIELELDNHVVDLNSDNIDLAIRIGTPKDSRLKARKLLTNRTVLVASPQYLKANLAITEPNDLSGHNCLLISQQRQKCHWYFSRENERHKVQVTGNFSSRGGSPILQGALHGSGVLLLSDWMVAPYLKQGTLINILPQWQVSYGEKRSDEIYALYKPSHYPKPHIRAFIDFIVQHLDSIDGLTGE
ncbi:LysR family transcriptional regulator [Vibrio sp. MarTm2]|uniref:LysR family transcriptional regulator n=1 Tax=Vibrio sp. MarTm2 TaxID=2998831 RepID=UPI0022CDAA85|nr:LysR family transcriptional regulator [Vibrio sp. MarTm2]MDA0128085.1 LysR family transcriptional regulator [Vibrio sp. MarTm2]